MSLEKLKWFRFFVPGVICSFYLYLFLNNTLPDNDFCEAGIYFFTTILSCFFYYSFNIRDKTWKRISERVIDRNIINGMINIKLNTYSKNKFTFFVLLNWFFDKNYKTSSLKEFYNYIDKDESLKNKSKIVMFNGAILTAILDLIIITIFFVFVDIVFNAFKKFEWFFLSTYSKVDNGKWLCVILVILFLSFICLYRVIKHHIELGEEQLEIINKLANKNDY